MRVLLPAILGTIFILSFLRTAVVAAPPARSISTSRQFLVYGSDVQLRGAVSDVAEETKKKLLALLHQRDNWKIPVVINAQLTQANLPDAPAAAVTLSQTETGPKIQLELAIDLHVNAVRVRRELLRALLLEMIYRDGVSVTPGTVYAQPPEWLLEGLLARQVGPEISRGTESLKTLVAVDRIAPLSDVLVQRPELLDSTARSIYRSYCYVLVELLVAGGGEKLAAFIRDLPVASTDPVADLTAHFPFFVAGDQDVNATWKAAVKRSLAADKLRLLTVAETEEALDELLLLAIPHTDARQPAAYRLEQFPSFIDEKAVTKSLMRLSRELQLLGTRANPICRPVVAEYGQIAWLLSRHKTHGVAARLADAQSLRARIVDRNRQIDDYLNWFEATQARGPSGMFVEYMKAAERAGDDPPARRDPISIYLTTLEAQLDH